MEHAAANGHAAREREGPRRPPAPDAAAWSQALSDVGAAAQDWLTVESLRARARLDRTLTRWLGRALLAVALAAVLLTAGVQLTLGLSGAFTALLDGPAWSGPLLTGLVLPALVLAGLAIARRRRALARLDRARQLAADETDASPTPPATARHPEPEG